MQQQTIPLMILLCDVLNINCYFFLKTKRNKKHQTKTGSAKIFLVVLLANSSELYDFSGYVCLNRAAVDSL